MPFDDILVHQLMLGDDVRMDAYETALRQLVTPDTRVLDFGCGTGILAFLAARAGASRVYAVDRSRFVRVAQLLARDNGFDNIRFFHGEADRLELPEQIDLLVWECLGSFAVDEWALAPLIAVRDRHLADGGRIVPHGVAIHAGLISDPALHRERAFLHGRPRSIDFSAVADWPFFRTENRTLKPEQLLPGTTCLTDIDLYTCTEPETVFAGHLVPGCDGTAYGICAWFAARLTDDIRLETGPFSPATHWRQKLFPLVEPLSVVRGKPIEIRIGMLRDKDDQNLWQWSVSDGEMRIDMDDFIHAAWVLRDLPEGRLT